STANTITGNYIGTDPTGMADLGNLGNGIAINGVTGAFNTFSDNVVSGNDLSGISISMTTAIQSLPNNIIGRNATNTANLPNFQHGVSFIEGTANMVMVGNTIAGSTPRRTPSSRSSSTPTRRPIHPASAKAKWSSATPAPPPTAAA